MARVMSTWVVVECTAKLSEQGDGAHLAEFVSGSGIRLEVRDIRDGGGSYAPQWFHGLKDGDRVTVSYILGQEHGQLRVEPLT